MDVEARLDDLRDHLRGQADAEATVALVAEIVRSADRALVGELQARHAGDITGTGRGQGRASKYKYIDLVYWTWLKLGMARRLGLHESAPLRIWDIGAGGCHFARVCRHFGHEVLSTDLDDAVYDAIAATMGERRTVSAIRSGEPTPDWGGRFDLITATDIKFNHRRDKPGWPYWDLDDWTWLYNDLIQRQLKTPGRIWFGLNRETRPTGDVFNPELMALCREAGADVVEGYGYIDWTVADPARTRLGRTEAAAR